MACTMGWAQSPPTFCAMSETATDLINDRIDSPDYEPPPHRLDNLVTTGDHWDPEPMLKGPEDSASDARLQEHCQPPRSSPEIERAPPSNLLADRPVGATDVYMDDFIQAYQGAPSHLLRARRGLFHTMDDILSQPAPGEERPEAISTKKLLKGDGCWTTRKELLGWIVDTVRQTLELPPHRKSQLADVFESLRGLKRVSAKKWARTLGQLRFVCRAILGSVSLFSALQWAKNKAGSNRIRVTKPVRGSILAFERLAASLCSRPTHLAELVPQDPTYLGATDPARPGMAATSLTLQDEATSGATHSPP